MSGQAGAREQVGRLLTLVPYLHSRGQVTLGEAARVLDVPPAQVVKDLKVLFMVGLPDGYPDDLIDVDLDALEGSDADGVIRVSNADYLARPLRLTATEATAVMVALLALRGGASDATREVVDRALAKLQAATADSADAPSVDPGTEQPGVTAGLRDDLERAVREGRQVRLTYWVPTRDEETERVVDPRRVVSSGGATYLAAWCHSAEDDRLFRLDRIHAATVLDSPVDPAVHAADRSASGDLFDFASGGERVTLELDPAARWVAEYHPVEDVRELPDGGVEADLLVADRRWLTRLLLRLAPYARVASPPARHQEFLAQAQQTLGLYDVGRVQ